MNTFLGFSLVGGAVGVAGVGVAVKIGVSVKEGGVVAGVGWGVDDTSGSELLSDSYNNIYVH